MNREIKFRAFIEYKNLSCGFPDYTLMMNVHSIDFVRGKLKAGNINETYKIKDVELIQYTGFKDKNGVEIYDGDIVKTPTRKGKIQFIWSGWYFHTDKDGFVELHDVIDIIEVIGNIYENKELLENEKSNIKNN